jgi:hypothetical protein
MNILYSRYNMCLYETSMNILYSRYNICVYRRLQLYKMFIEGSYKHICCIYYIRCSLKPPINTCCIYYIRCSLKPPINICCIYYLYVFVFLFFFSIVIGNKLIKRNYLINFFYYRLITKCNIILINWFNYKSPIRRAYKLQVYRVVAPIKLHRHLRIKARWRSKPTLFNLYISKGTTI